jgi:hypothetical protein
MKKSLRLVLVFATMVPASWASQAPTAKQVDAPAATGQADDRRAAAGMYVSLSSAQIAAMVAILPFFATIYVFLGERHQTGWYDGIFAWLGVILSVVSCGLGGIGINEVAVPGFEGKWELNNYWFMRQTYMALMAIFLLAVSINIMVLKPKKKEAVPTPQPNDAPPSDRREVHPTA